MCFVFFECEIVFEISFAIVFFLLLELDCNLSRRYIGVDFGVAYCGVYLLFLEGVCNWFDQLFGVDYFGFFTFLV